MISLYEKEDACEYAEYNHYYQEEINHSDALSSSYIPNTVLSDYSQTNTIENNFMYLDGPTHDGKHYSNSVLFLNEKYVNHFRSIDCNMCIWIMLFVLIGTFYHNIFDYVIPIISSWLIFHMLRIGNRVKLIMNNTSKIVLYITIILYSVSNMRIVSCTQYSLLSKILATDGAPSDSFGRSVSIYDTNAFIGTKYDDDKATDAGITVIMIFNKYMYFL